ncbi:hypothetical protein [Reinekea sp. G2M2-21]|uniref:hypothetical protein n=1 Tax=Reinekea sp. G2M2-21 TaxID=2788942 RepID=UPI0018AA7AE1|nr:hypothetical protein [Reinekea sp. G2M2-21]
MNLANTFARVRALFPRRAAKSIRLIGANEHLRRDLGLDNVNSERRVHERAPRTQEYIVFGAVTRAP